MASLDLLEDEDLVATGSTRHGRAEYRLTRSIIFETLTIPPGFVTDKYSLPGRLIPFLWQPKKAKFATPAVIHDWLYETRWFGEGEDAREKADAILLRAMTALRISPWRRWIAWAAVRLGGRAGYGIVDADNIPLVRAVRPDLEDVLA